MIKTVIFDLGNVIVPFDFGRGYRALEPLCSYPAAEIPKRLSTGDLVVRFESGQLSPAAFVAEMREVLELRVDYDQFCDIWNTIFLPHTLVSESLLEGLKDRYRLLLLSNTNAIHWEMLRQTYPLLRHFHKHLLSFEIGAMKPSPKIYQTAIEAAGSKPEECFFTDDVLAYVEGAKREGIDAVQFQSGEQIEAELRARGVSW